MSLKFYSIQPRALEMLREAVPQIALPPAEATTTAAAQFVDGALSIRAFGVYGTRIYSFRTIIQPRNTTVSVETSSYNNIDNPRVEAIRRVLKINSANQALLFAAFNPDLPKNALADDAQLFRSLLVLMEEVSPI